MVEARRIHWTLRRRPGGRQEPSTPVPRPEACLSPTVASFIREAVEAQLLNTLWLAT
jgi:hypothetical protein